MFNKMDESMGWCCLAANDAEHHCDVSSSVLLGAATGLSHTRRVPPSFYRIASNFVINVECF